MPNHPQVKDQILVPDITDEVITVDDYDPFMHAYGLSWVSKMAYWGMGKGFVRRSQAWFIANPDKWQYAKVQSEHTDDICFHDWKLYKGFTDIYTYCTKCDAKLK